MFPNHSLGINDVTYMERTFQNLIFQCPSLVFCNQGNSDTNVASKLLINEMTLLDVV